MYLTREANAALLRDAATLAPGSTLVMTFSKPIELVEPGLRSGLATAATGARASGTPFLSFFTPEDMFTLAREAGFREVRHIPGAELAQRYFAGRADYLRNASAEEMLVAET
jgi:O-methyltransferase involved in polyketide biosynthesis